MTELRFDLAADVLHAPRWATLHDPDGPAPAGPARGVLADHDRQALYRALRGNAFDPAFVAREIAATQEIEHVLSWMPFRAT